MGDGMTRPGRCRWGLPEAVATLLLCLLLGAGAAAGDELGLKASAQARNSGPVQAQVLRIATAQSGSRYQQLGVLLAALWTQRLEGVEVQVQLTQGSPHNVELLRAGAVELAFLRADWANQVYYGSAEGMAGPEDGFQGMTFVTHVYPEVLHFLGDSSIRTLQDIAGQPVAVDMMGSHGEWAVRQRILPLVPLDYSAFQPQFTGLPWAVDQVRYLQIAGYLGFEPVPSPDIAQMLATGRVRLRSLDPQLVVAASDGAFYPFTIPAGTYPGQDADIHTLATAIILVARPDLDEELVYQLTRWLYQEQDNPLSSYPSARWIKTRYALHGQTFPIHPGAQRFYRELSILP